jgi:hypothetical protein
MTLISEKARATIANLQARLAKATGRDNLIQAAAAASAKRAPLDVPSARQMDELQELRNEELALCQKLNIPAGNPPIFSGQSVAQIKAQAADWHVTCAELTRLANTAPPVKAPVAIRPASRPAIKATKAAPALRGTTPNAEAIAKAILDEQERRATAPLSRAEFSKLTPAAKMAFVKAGRQITA